MTDLEEYLEARTEIAFDGCWNWKLHRSRKGYGRAKWCGKKYQAHRLAFLCAKGSLPAPPLVIRHTCDNPACCNPAHLIEGTVADNNRDKAERGRCTPCPGERHGRAKLTEPDVIAIRTSGESQRALAGFYGVSRRTIRDIISGNRWSYISERTCNG